MERIKDDPGREGVWSEFEGRQPSDRENDKLVRLVKSIVVHPDPGRTVDEKVIQYKYYNSFNYSMLSRGQSDVRMTIGITSPREGEGKTLVASNLAVSLALGSQKNTVLVDLNIHSPRLHEIFDVLQFPGLAESLRNGRIHIFRTSIDHLSVMTVGNFGLPKPRKHPAASGASPHSRPAVPDRPTIGLEQLAAFRDIIYSLEQEFEFVIVDMPSITAGGIPILFANEMNGLLIVVNSGKTRREDLDAMFRQISERQVLGFVFNRFKDRSLS